MGLLRDDFSWEENGEELQEECGIRVKLRYMGDSVVLVQNMSEWPQKEMIKQMDELFSHCFEWLRPWEPRDVCEKKRVWSAWRGIPLHAWNERFFQLASGELGTFIKVDEDTTNKVRLNVARVLLSVPFYKDINRCITVQIEGRSYTIKIVEEFLLVQL